MGCCTSIIENYKLGKCNNDNVPWLSFEGNTMRCKVISVYDADTVTIAFRFHGVFYKKKCRLEGIDAAELHSKNEEERFHAELGKKRLENLVLNKVIYIVCGDWDKYGRLLGTLYLGDRNINDILIREGWAYSYNGKKKIPFSEWFKQPCIPL